MNPILLALGKITLLGGAPIRTQAIAQKCRKTPMRETGVVELELFQEQLREVFTLDNVKAQAMRTDRLTVSCLVTSAYLRSTLARSTLPKEKERDSRANIE